MCRIVITFSLEVLFCIFLISSVLIDLGILLVESLCQNVQLMAPVYTPVLHVPQFLVFVRVQSKQLTPV